MAQQNKLSLQIPEADLEAINNAMDILVTTLTPHLKTLSLEDRKEMPKMGDKSVAFVEKAREYAQQNPDLVPGYLDMAAFDEDREAVQILSSLTRQLQPLADNLEDTLMLAGSEAYQAALVFYNNVKMAKKVDVPNSKTIYDDLVSRFPQGSRRTSNSE